MLHNNGPYGPNDVPVNVNAQTNMTDLSGQINSGHNISKLAQPPSYASNAHFNLSDYASYGLNVNSPLSPFHNFHQVGYQSNLVSSNSIQDSWQPNVLPMNLNTQSDHHTHGYYDKKYATHHDFPHNYHKNMLNIPQVYPKPHKHLGMETSYPQYNHALNNFNHYFEHNLDLSVKSQRAADMRHFSDVSLDLLRSQKPIQNQDQLDLSNKMPIRGETVAKSYEPNRAYKVGMQPMNLGNLDLSLKSSNSDSVNSKSTKNNVINACYNPNLLFTMPEKIHDFTNINQNLDLSIKPQRVEPTDSIDKPVIDHVRRRNLANTVKMIEDILSQTTNLKRKELERNETVTNFTDTDEDTCDVNKKEEDVETDKIDETHMSDKTCDDSNSAKADEALPSDDSNASTEISMLSETKDKTTENAIKSPKCESSDSEISEESDDDGKSVTDKDKEQIEPDIVKMEISADYEKTDHSNPFSKDIYAVEKPNITSCKVHDPEKSVTVAKDIIKSGNITRDEYFECMYCNVYYDHPKRFLIHTKWHSFGLTHEKRLEMQKAKEMKKQMQKEARVLEDMKKHEITDVVEGKTYNCKDCDKVFCKKASLKNHQQWYHPKRHRECKICGKVLPSWVELRDHHLTHVGEAGFQCDDCPKRFKYSHSLAKHRDTHLEKTHACPQCPKKFGSAALLHVHSKTHERMLRGATFRCTYCGKGFFESYHLQAHERTHRNERPYVCEICKTTFGTNSGLKRHLKVSHSTSKPYECSICHRSFMSEAIRDRHEIRNHGDPEDFKFVCKQCPCRYLKQKDLRKHVYKVHPKGKRKKKAVSEEESH